jgi:propanol-preferring alcohol dehydrogenase
VIIVLQDGKLCEAQKNGGYSVDGGFAEYVIADSRYVGHLKSDVNFLEIAPIFVPE